MTDATRTREVLERAARKVKALEQELQALRDPIAVIGMSCRFPGGAEDPQAFWRLLHEQRDAVTTIPPERARMLGARSAVRAGLIGSVEAFDASFFGISPREAEPLDPQQRLVLELGWEACEDAGVVPATLEGQPVGVFLGVGSRGYERRACDFDRFGQYAFTGTNTSFMAGRLSYVLGLRGPSFVVDTACSSSLVAVALAVASLRRRECDLALAGGAHLILEEVATELWTRNNVLAPDGRCKTFDAAADGYGRGEGAGLVLLKRASDAARDGDRVRALIRGCAINHDGRSAGITAPNAQAQRQLLERALLDAGVRADELGFIETHGTGTSLGDPIEIDALKSVFGARRDGGSCALGALKTNIGHLEAAAGIAGLIKVVLCLEQQTIPANLHFQRLNPRISLASTPFVLPTKTAPWSAGRAPRCAGVSSFGLSGTNAHVLVAEAPLAAASADASQRDTHVLAISARSPGALAAQAGRYARALERSPAQALGDLCFTANVRRAHHAQRFCVLGSTAAELSAALQERAAAAPPARLDSNAGRGVVFMFSGHGSQWRGMGRELLGAAGAFRDAFERVDAAVRGEAGWSPCEVLCGAGDWPLDPRVVQPLLFAMAVGLDAQWRSWGIEPGAVVGHSMGEIAAAHASGALTLQDAVRVICARGEALSHAGGEGSMLLVRLGTEAAERATEPCRGAVTIGVELSPETCVLTGDRTALRALAADFAQSGVFCRMVDIHHAPHGAQMDALAPTLLRRLALLQPQRAAIPMYSTLLKEPVTGEELDGAYWARNLCERVRFQGAVERLIADGHSDFIELSPHPLVLQSVLEVARGAGTPVSVFASLRRGQPEERGLLSSLAAVYERGSDVRWTALYPHGRVVDLPSYPWQRQRYWVDSAAEPQPSAADAGAQRRMFLDVAWEPVPRQNVDADGGKGRALLLCDRQCALAPALHRALAARGTDVVIAYPGTAFKTLADGHFEVPIDSAAGMERLLRSAAHGGALRQVVALWDLGVQCEDATALARKLRVRCGSTLALLQALHAAAFRDAPRLVLVTRGAHPIAPALERIEASEAALYGLGQTIALEHPELACVRLDLSGLEASEVEAEQLAIELCGAPAEDVVAWRAGSRYVARLTEVDAPVAARAVDALFDAQASYLISGGTGALGLALAEWLVACGVRHLVLMARRGASPEVASRLRALEAQGVALTCVTADVSDPQAVRDVIARVRSELPPLRGVFHTAGIVDDSLLVRRRWPEIEAVLAPKALGAFNLHAETRDLELDYFVLYSSGAVLLGNEGAASYTAANAYLDALAGMRAQRGLAALSIDWGTFYRTGVAAKRTDLAKEQCLHVDEAHAVLGRLLGAQRARIAVFPIDLAQWIEMHPVAAGASMLAQLAPRAHSRRHMLDELRATLQPGQRFPRLFELVRAEVAQVLHASPRDIAVRVPFGSLGMDSLMGLELRNRLSSATGLNLSAAVVWTYSDVETLAQHVYEQLFGEPESLPLIAAEREPTLSELTLSELSSRLQELVR